VTPAPLGLAPPVPTLAHVAQAYTASSLPSVWQPRDLRQRGQATTSLLRGVNKEDRTLTLREHNDSALLSLICFAPPWNRTPGYSSKRRSLASLLRRVLSHPLSQGKGRLWRTGATTRRLTHAAFGVSIAMRVCVLVLRHLVCARLRLWRWHPDEAVTNATFELNINDWNFGHCSLVDSACSLTRNLSRLCLDQTHEGQADALQTA
jgi:hypothetical protein